MGVPSRTSAPTPALDQTFDIQIILGKVRPFLRRLAEAHPQVLIIAPTLQKKAFTRPWVVSYDDVEPIRDMYQHSASLSYGLNYTAQRRYVGSEVMFFSNRLNV